jgi:hypothetical protein
MVSFKLRVAFPTPLGENVPGHFWIGDRVGHRAGLEAVEKNEMSYSCRELNPQSLVRPACNIVTMPTPESRSEE